MHLRWTVQGGGVVFGFGLTLVKIFLCSLLKMPFPCEVSQAGARVGARVSAVQYTAKVSDRVLTIHFIDSSKG